MPLSFFATSFLKYVAGSMIGSIPAYLSFEVTVKSRKVAVTGRPSNLSLCLCPKSG